MAGFEVILLFVGIYFILAGKLDWALTTVVFMSMSYMGLGGSSSIICGETIGRLNCAMVLAVVFSCYCFIHYKKPVSMDRGQMKIHHLLTVFFVYMLFVIVLDELINQTRLWSIFRTQRHWLFLLFWIPLCRLPREMFEKTIHHLYLLTIIISAIILLEGMTGLYIFTHGYIDNSTSVVDLERGALSCVTALLYIFMLYAGYGKASKWVGYSFMALMVFTIVDSAVRSAFMALGLGLLIMAYYLSKNRVKVMGQVIVAVLLLVSIVYATPALRTRMLESEELSVAIKSGGEVEGTMSFRTQFLLERIEYVSNDLAQFLFGVGSIPSDEFTGHQFRIASIQAFESGDISWVGIVCRTGMVGTVFFIYMTIVIIRFFFKNKRKSLYALPMAAYVTIWLFPMSFAGSNMQFGQFWILPLIFANMVVKDKNEKNEFYQHKL